MGAGLRGQDRRCPGQTQITLPSGGGAPWTCLLDAVHSATTFFFATMSQKPAVQALPHFADDVKSRLGVDTIEPQAQENLRPGLRKESGISVAGANWQENLRPGLGREVASRSQKRSGLEGPPPNRGRLVRLNFFENSTP